MRVYIGAVVIQLWEKLSRNGVVFTLLAMADQENFEIYNYRGRF